MTREIILQIDLEILGEAAAGAPIRDVFSCIRGDHQAWFRQALDAVIAHLALQEGPLRSPGKPVNVSCG